VGVNQPTQWLQSQAEGGGCRAASAEKNFKLSHVSLSNRAPGPHCSLSRCAPARVLTTSDTMFGQHDWRFEEEIVQCDVSKDSGEKGWQYYELRERSADMSTCDNCDKTLCAECVQAADVVDCDACGSSW